MFFEGLIDRIEALEREVDILRCSHSNTVYDCYGYAKGDGGRLCLMGSSTGL